MIMLFQAPPVSRYDLRFSIARIPVRVHPLFWLMALLFGSGMRNLLYILIWVVVVFISILIHELGHSFAMRLFGQNSRIVLYMGGGLAIPEGARWGGGYAAASTARRQQIIISLAGPFAGFLFAALILLGVVVAGGTVSMDWLFGFIPQPQFTLPFGGVTAFVVVRMFLWVNVFWGFINLMPVIPLDGGHVSQQILTGVDPWDGMRKALWVSVVAGVLVGIAGFFVMGSIYIALFFGFLAFQSYQMLQGPVARGY